MFVAPAFAFAIPVSWDRFQVGGVRPLYILDTVFGNIFTATSTTQASTFPYASTTAFSFTSTSTGTAGINITSGCFAFGGVCINGGGTIGAGTTGQVAYYNATNQAVGTSTLFINTTSQVGVGSTTPWGLLSIGVPDNSPTPQFAIGSSSKVSLFVGPTGAVSIGTSTNTGNRNLLITSDDNSATPVMQLRNWNSGSAANTNFFVTNDVAGGFNEIVYGSGFSTSSLKTPNSGHFITSGALTNGMVLGTSGATAPLIFVQGGANTEIMRLYNGFLGIASTSPGSLLSIGGGNITQTATSPTLIATALTTNTIRGIIISGRYMYVVESAAASGLEIFDISDVRSPKLITTFALTNAGAGQPVLSGSYLYIPESVAATAVQIVDVSNPTSPVIVSSIKNAAAGRSVQVSGSYLYVGVGGVTTNQFLIYGITNPTSPVLLSATTVSANVNNLVNIQLQGPYAFLGEGTTTASGAGLQILDVSNPTTPSIVSTYATQNPVRSVLVSGRYVFLGETVASSGLEIVDISNPVTPVLAKVFAVNSAISGANAQITALQRAGNYLYYMGASTASNNLQVLDISSSTEPVSVGSVTMADSALGSDFDGQYLYAALSTGPPSKIEIYQTSGANIPTITTGVMKLDTLHVTGNAAFAKDVFMQGGLSVGYQGIFSRGRIAAYVASSTEINPIAGIFAGGSLQAANSLLVGTTSTTTMQSAFHVSALTSIFGRVVSGIASAFNLGFASSTNADTAGADVTIDASNGEGAGGSGALIFRTASSTASITLDATSTANTATATATNLTWSHTVGASCASPLLIITVAAGTGAGTTITASSSVSGNATSRVDVTSTGSAHLVVFSITNPTAGAQTLSVTNNSANRFAVSGASYCNVNQTTPFGTIQTTSSGAATSLSLTANATSTTGIGNVLFDALAKRDTTEFPTAGAGQTNIATSSTTNGTLSLNSILGNSQRTVNGVSTATSWSWATARAASYAQLPLISVSGTTANVLTDRLHITPNGAVGIGTATPTDVNANSHLTVSGIGTQDIIASTTDNTSTSAAILEAYSDSSRTFFGAHGSNQTTSRFGITLGGWGEIANMNSSASTTNGLIIGVIANKPLVFGTNSLEKGRFNATGEFGLGTTTPAAPFSLSAASSTVAFSPVTMFTTIINAISYIVEEIDQWGHLIIAGPAPTLSSCGTSPSVTGNDRVMTVTVGSVTASGCTITFAHAYAARPTCNITNESASVVNAMSYVTTASTITVTQTALTSAILDIQCAQGK